MVGDRTRMVKEFSRSAAGKQEADFSSLRTPHTLLQTTHYLFSRIVNKRDCAWSKVYEYVFDRLRAVRQDMVIQQLDGRCAVTLLERSIRFLVYANYRLCRAGLPEYDAKINETHIQECLKRLLCIYNEDQNACRCNSSEFHAIYISFNAGSSEALNYALQHQDQLREDAVYKLAMKVSLAQYNRNYHRSLRLGQTLPALLQCALHRNVPRIHRMAMEVMSAGYNRLRYSIHDLRNTLCADSEDHARTICENCNLTVDGNGVQFLKSNFSDAAKIEPCRYQALDDLLEYQSLPTLLEGQPCHCLDNAS